MRALRYLTAIVLWLGVGIWVTLVAWVLQWLVEHLTWSVFYVLPAGHARSAIGAVLAYFAGPCCLRCGAARPTIGELLQHHHHHPPGPPAAP